MQHNPRQILLVAARSRARTSTSKFLQSAGYRIIESVPGQQAEKCFKAQPVDLVVMIAGNDPQRCANTCRRIRTLRGGQFVPILFALANDSPEAVHEAYDFGATDLLLAPVDPALLAQRIEAQLANSNTLRRLEPAAAAAAESEQHPAPDMAFIVGRDGTIREYLGRGSADARIAPGARAGVRVAEVWSGQIADTVSRYLRRTLMTRDSHSVAFDVPDGDAVRRCDFRFFAHGRDRVLLVIHDASKPGAARGRDDTSPSEDRATALPGETALMQRLADAVCDARLRERALAVLCIELDERGRLLRMLDRDARETLEAHAATQLAECLRTTQTGTVATPGGGDEIARLDDGAFAILLTDVRSRREAATVASRAVSALLAPCRIGTHELVAAPSVGIALFPQDGGDGPTLMNNARAAAREARFTSPDGRQFFSDTARMQPVAKLDLASELRAAIDQNLLELHYQPRVELASDRVAGVEALLRWGHRLGNVPMSDLIPLAESTGLSIPLGDWVLNRACADRQSWDAEDLPPMHVSVNVSPREFLNGDLPARVERALSATGLAPQWLELELTERTLMRAPDARAALERLAELGVSIVLDDFGTGFSSLGMLTGLQIKAVKIDCSFVQRAEPGNRDEAACAAVIAMAHELGFVVIAEGVETQAQLDFLRERGCDQLHGFLHSRPMPAEALVPFVRESHSGRGQPRVASVTRIR